MTLFEALERTIRARVLRAMDTIPPGRQAALDRLAAYLRARLDAGQLADATFVCTHNSRRSQMAQLWARAAAARCGLDGVRTFSGGTEVTAFAPRAVDALAAAGFELDAAAGDNPRYRVRIGPDAAPIECFSKRVDDPPNPTSGFAAVMTCAEADRACPLVPGADLRVALPYDDPKNADGTPDEARVYDERSVQIAREAFFLMSRVRG